MEPATGKSASNQLSSARNYAGGFSRQKRRELQNQFETGLQWLEQEPPDYDHALKLFASCMKADPMGAVYTYEFLQTLEAGYQKGLYCHSWRQRRRNQKLVKRITDLGAEEQWHEILNRAPETLYHNARNERLLLELAFAAQTINAAETQWVYLEFALKYFSGSADVHVQIIHAFYQSGRYDDANDHIFNLIKIADDSVIQKVLRALPSVITQQFPAVEAVAEAETLRTLAKQAVTQHDHWLKLCEILEDLNLYGQAIDACQQATKLLGNPSEWTQRILDLRLHQAESRLAFHEELKASEELLGQLQHEVWRVRTEYYQTLAAQYPARPLLSIQLGWCLVGTGNWYEAIKVFDQLQQTKAVKNPDKLALLLGLAESQQAVRRFEEALATYSQLQSAIDISKSEKENLDKWMRDEIPGFHRQSFIERSLKRIKTLANSMNSPPSSEILPTNRKK